MNQAKERHYLIKKPSWAATERQLTLIPQQTKCREGKDFASNKLTRSKLSNAHHQHLQSEPYLLSKEVKEILKHW